MFGVKNPPFAAKDARKITENCQSA